MAAEVPSHGGHDSARIDMTPMVDCMMVLVIFLIVSSAFVQDPGVEVQKPDVRASDVAERSALLIAITADNRIYFDGQEIRLEQVSALVQKAAFGQELPLIIRADKSCSHGVFSSVYTEAKRAGITHVQFATASSDAR